MRQLAVTLACDGAITSFDLCLWAADRTFGVAARPEAAIGREDLQLRLALGGNRRWPAEWLVLRDARTSLFVAGISRSIVLLPESVVASRVCVPPAW